MSGCTCKIYIYEVHIHILYFRNNALNLPSTTPGTTQNVITGGRSDKYILRLKASIHDRKIILCTYRRTRYIKCVTNYRCYNSYELRGPIDIHKNVDILQQTCRETSSDNRKNLVLDNRKENQAVERRCFCACRKQTKDLRQQYSES